MINYLAAKLFGLGVFESKVPGFEGPCHYTWLNRNIVCHRLDGGVSGFFKLMSGSKEFHGIIWSDGQVHSTEHVYSTFRGPKTAAASVERRLPVDI
jgi:hypothetical protein